AAVREPVVEAESDTAADDVRLAQRDERRVHAEARALDAGARRQAGEALEGGDELGAAIGIARIVERVDADDDVVRAEDLGPAECDRQEDRVARGHVGGRNLRRVQAAAVRYGRARRERRSADGAQVEVELEVPLDAERARDGARRLDLTRVPLPVVDREREQREALLPGHRGGGIGVEPPAEQHDRAHVYTPRVSGCQMYLWSCSWRRAGTRSASIHSDSVFGSRTPCTGERSTAAARAGSAYRAMTPRAK